jgi:hypothetical protein
MDEGPKGVLDLPLTQRLARSDTRIVRACVTKRRSGQ